MEEPMIEEFQVPVSSPMDEIENKAKNLSAEIEELKAKHPELNYIECTVHICLKYDVDFDYVKKVLTKPIKEKIELDAMNLNLLNYKNNTLL